MLKQIVLYIKGKNHYVQCKALSREQTLHNRPRSVAIHGVVRTTFLLAKHQK